MALMMGVTDPAVRFVVKKRTAIRHAKESASDFLADARNIARGGANLVRQLGESPRIGKEVATYFVAAAVLILIGTVLLCLSLIHLLVWAAPGQPVWAAYGEVTLGVLLIAAILGAIGRHRMRRFDALKQQSANLIETVAAAADHAGDTVQAARETIQKAAR